MGPGASSILRKEIALHELAHARVAASPERASAWDQGPVRVKLVHMPPETSAANCMSALLTIHAEAIARNLDCVLTSVDPEGPHQLRIALRRLRVSVRAFRPIMREAKAEELLAAGRRIGAIVSDLRDADVLIDEIMAPAAPRGAQVIDALNDWRHEVRGRVRARLSAVGAQRFAAGLVEAARGFAWRKRSDAARAQPASVYLTAFDTRCRQRVTRAAAGMPHLPIGQIHDLRKEVKVLRYASEIADCVLRSDGNVVRALKQVQDDLGHVHDAATLERFAPPLVREGSSFASLRDHAIAQRKESIAAALVSADARLRELGVGAASVAAAS